MAGNPLDLVIGPLILDEQGNQMVPERMAGYKLGYPGLVNKPLGPPLQGCIRGLDNPLVLAYLVPRDILLKQYQGSIIKKDLPPLVVLCLLELLLNRRPKAFVPDINISRRDLLYHGDKIGISRWVVYVSY